MLIVYGMAQGGAMELRLGGGHAAIALAGLGHDATYISWIRVGHSPVFNKFKKGPFGTPVYRVCIPSNEDLNLNIGISERDVYNWVYKELAGEGLRQYTLDTRIHRIESLPFGPLYYKYNCVDIVKNCLAVSGAYHYARSLLPTWTVAGVCGDAAKIRRAVLRRLSSAVDPALQITRLPTPPDFFREDEKREQNIEPAG
ncbi:hypothetical protein [Chelatococcus asaccharovorans]|uniref:hypothetical protein n=1 Tax=Chelatococcus asaccharovorans TaxID=28210 RepID=UPI00224C7846|nr:hypothetical protein [Chelatococcus asaccharovorans]CAH1664470.1 conserved hypothetical protein [Chelatococcus asaccharovorans]CAH1682386.1 conserved hypothetical protein [Chelatococcus asaccharovorans]